MALFDFDFSRWWDIPLAGRQIGLDSTPRLHDRLERLENLQEKSQHKHSCCGFKAGRA